MKKVNHNKELNDKIEDLEKEMHRKKELPKDIQTKINKKVFENISIAGIIMLLLFCTSFCSINIDNLIFIIFLKTLSIVLILLTIFLFEKSYKKEDGNICIHGLECFVLALFTLMSIYLYTMYVKNFHMIALSVSFIFGVYYIGKAIVIYIKIRKEYVASLSDISEIIKK